MVESAQDRDYWRGLVNGIEPLGYINRGVSTLWDNFIYKKLVFSKLQIKKTKLKYWKIINIKNTEGKTLALITKGEDVS